MMMGFGGMMNAGNMGMQNPYLLQQQQLGIPATQQPLPQTGGSPFPPPVTRSGNIYDPPKKEQNSVFPMPNLSVPNADWGEVAYNSTLAMGGGAIIGSVAGLGNNYAKAPGLGSVYEVKENGKVTAQQRFEPSDGFSGRVAQSHITGDGVNASIIYEYAPERGPVKRFFRWGSDHDLANLTVKSDKGNVMLERGGLLGNDYKLPLPNGGEIIYHRQKNGNFVPHKVIIDENTTVHFDAQGNVKGVVPQHLNVDDFKLHKQLNLPEGVKIQTHMPNASTLTHLQGKALDSRLAKGLGKWAIGAAVLSAVTVGGYTAWKSSQPKSGEELLKSLPPQGVGFPPINGQPQGFVQGLPPTQA
jgi:hypothetical protein